MYENANSNAGSQVHHHTTHEVMNEFVLECYQGNILYWSGFFYHSSLTKSSTFLN